MLCIYLWNDYIHILLLSPAGRMPRTGDIGFMSVRPSVRPSVLNRGVVSFIVPRGANAPNGGRRIHVCPSVRPSVRNRGGTLCARLSRNIFTYLHTLDANQLYNDCRCATYLSFFDLDFISDPGQGHKKLCFPAYFI